MGDHGEIFSVLSIQFMTGGFYQDELGRTASIPGGLSCKECNNGTYVKNGSGKSIKDCEVCPEGTNQSIPAGFRACFCRDGYARTDRYGPCFVCPKEGFDCSKDYKMIGFGFFWSWDFSSANITSYKRFASNLQVENEKLSPFTSYTGVIPSTFRCPRKESCPNSNGEIEGQCADGYAGWLCTSCLSGYYSVLNTCIRCPGKEKLALEIGAFFSICVLICYLVSWQMKRDANRGNQSRSFIDVFISRVKILLGFYQVVGEVYASLHDMKWEGPLVVIGAVISSLELNILRIFVRPRCISETLVLNPKIKFIIAVSSPAIIMLTPIFIFQARKVYLKFKNLFLRSPHFHLNLGKLRTRLLSCVTVLLFICYPPICSVIFELYPRACKTFFLDNDKTYNVTRLRSDYDYNCNDLLVYQKCAYIFTVLYVVMFPAVLLYMLWVNIRRQPAGRMEQRNLSSQDDVCHEDELRPLVSNDSKDKAASPPLWLTFLCENYKPRYWFWEIIELSRKVIQTLLITLYGWEDRLTVLLTTCISVLFLLLHAWYKPMKERHEQRLQMISLVLIFINVLVAANDVPKDNFQESISVFLILLNVIVLVIVVGEVLLTLLVYIRRHNFPQKLPRLLKSLTLNWKEKR